MQLTKQWRSEFKTAHRVFRHRKIEKIYLNNMLATYSQVEFVVLLN